MRVHEGRLEALARKKRETLVAPDLGEIMRIGRDGVPVTVLDPSYPQQCYRYFKLFK